MSPSTQGEWQDLNAGNLRLTDAGGWNLPQYYRTLRLADINAVGQTELLVRASVGLLTFAFDQTSGKWVSLQSDNLGLSDAAGWSNPQYYSTIQTADV